MKKTLEDLNCLFAIVLSCVILAGYTVQYTRHENPCPLCMLQRLAMIGVSIGPLLNLRFGVKMQHYGLSILFALFGMSVSLRQIALHVCPGFPSFGEPVFGLSLYSWAFLTFAISLLAIAILMSVFKFTHNSEQPLKLHLFGKLAFGFVFLVSIADAITTYMQCSMSTCAG